MKTTLPAALALALMATGACSLFVRSTPLEVRRFSPETAPGAQKTLERPKGVATVVLGRVTAASDLGPRIVRRTSPVEVEPYDALSWTETPDAYVRRSLSRALFEQRPLEEAVGGQVPTLDVDVVAFEEAGPALGRVQLRYRLVSGRAVVARGEVTQTRSAQGDDFGATALAIGQAMDAATAQIADAVVRALTPPAAPVSSN